MAVFRWRHFAGEIILWAVRWYCRYGISYRELEEMMGERGVAVDHTTLYRWTQRYAPELEKRSAWYRSRLSFSWRVDETYVRVKGRWKYLYRAIDKDGATLDFYLADRRNAKAWPRVFGDRGGLFDACVSIYDNVEPVGSWGGNLRGLYAEFLDEAAGLLGDDRLRPAAAAYRDLAARWRAVAEVALPADREPFAEVRRLTGELARLLALGDAGRPRAAAVASQLWAARDRWRSEFPGGDADAFLAELAAAVGAVHEAETAALATLGRALQAR